MVKVKFIKFMAGLLAASSLMTALPVHAGEKQYDPFANVYMICPIEEVSGYQPPADEILGANVALNAPVTKENIVSLLEEYDPDGAYIIKDSIKHGDDVTRWWSSGEDIMDCLETAVHEETHGYIWNNGTWGWDSSTDGFYIGNGQTVNVRQTKVYPSVEMAQTVPQELRTFRYDTYIGNPDPYMSSNVEGVYGLLNEFTAYYWGAHNSERMYQYLLDTNASTEDWHSNFNLYGNGWVAYAEFKYYIIKYLEYAKTHYPEIYADILDNKEFVAVYNTIEGLYAEQNQVTINRVKQEGAKRDLEYLYSFYIGDYNKLTKELEKPEYMAVIKDLGGNGNVIPGIFADVPYNPGNWKYEAVKFVYDNKLMNGVGDGTRFDPDAPLTREMFATVLYRMAGEPAVTYTRKFPDVPGGKWYSNAVIWASEQGIVSGYGSGNFGTGHYITREQIAKMFMEYGKMQGYDVSQRAEFSTFTDAASVSEWANDYMEWAVGSGMIGGSKKDGKDYLNPNGNATRAECATMLKRFMLKYYISES